MTYAHPSAAGCRLADQAAGAAVGIVRVMADHPFAALDDYLAIPRVTGLVLSPDGSRLVCSVQMLAADRTSYVTGLWDVDPLGERPARRLTRSTNGESSPAFMPNGDLVFVSKRSDVVGADDSPGTGGGAKDSDDELAAVWVLPASGGEARPLVSAAADVSAVLVAAAAPAVFVKVPALPGAADDDATRRKARKDAGISAILHETAPIRHWDHDLGPDQLRLFAADLDTATDAGACTTALRDLTPSPGRGLDEAAIAVSPDGAQLAVSWRTPLGRGRDGRSLVVIATADGARRVLAEPTPDGEAAGEKHDYDEPAFSPDGRLVVCVDVRDGDYDTAPTVTLRLFDLASGSSRDLTPGFSLWPAAPAFSADSAAVFFVADERGHRPVFRVDVESGAVTRLTADGAYSEVSVSPDGRTLFALRSAIDAPPTPVRLDVDATDQKPDELPAPGNGFAVPGRLVDIETSAPDGATVRGWLVLPESASPQQPAPLALWVHGGPLMSWESWSWRWNPWLLAARGWAVLLPDPGLSQGYGDEFIQRAWGKWGPVPFADLMAITDAVAARADIDETRTAAMGGSYGGYMANWIAGHTQRFKAIVSHAGLWTLEHFIGATDHPGGWEQEWGHPLERPERYELNGPSRHLHAVTTPMLVIHGDKDYRVPIGEALRLWSDLVRQQVDAKFLYFPDENHWILKPGNTKAWYQTVFAFLDHHVLGADWTRPELL
jgi:dipeptidyl aminopeptidase/acylaminoacyl peptidase